MKSKLDEAKIDGNNIVVTIPISLLVYAAKGNPDYFDVRIKDETAYAQAVAMKLINFNEDGETGISQFHKLFDDIQDELVEEANPSIQIKWSPDSPWE